MEWDKRAMKTDQAWRENTPRDGETEHYVWEQLRDIWACLYVVPEDFGFLQCIKRRPSSEVVSKNALASMRQHWQVIISGIFSSWIEN